MNATYVAIIVMHKIDVCQKKKKKKTFYNIKVDNNNNDLYSLPIPTYIELGT